MIPTRQLELASADVIGLSYEYPVGFEAVHSHEDFGQIMYAVRGAMTVSTPQGSWVLPPQRALWIPAGVPHAFSRSRPVSLRAVYVRRHTDGMPAWARCTVMQVSALVRELILSCIRAPWDHAPDGRAARLGRVLLDHLVRLKTDSFYLREPVDPRAVKAALIARKDPAHSLSLKEIAGKAGASERTLDRLFTAETDMGFGAWRRCLRLTLAMERLAVGESVGTVAAAIGYENPSSFIAAFKSAFGATPAKYFSP